LINLAEIQVYPNPASDFVNINFPVYGKYDVVLINGNGQLMNNPVTGYLWKQREAECFDHEKWHLLCVDSS
jgi:hypothetical protein